MKRSVRQQLRSRSILALRLIGGVLFLFLFRLLWREEVPEELLIDRHRYEREITAAAAKYGLPVPLVQALILRESRFNPGAVGSRGEIGLMQLMPSEKPGAASEWARVNHRPLPTRTELFRVPLNLEIGCWFLARSLKQWRNYRCATELALAQYNAGFARVSRWKPENFDGDLLPRIDIPSTRRYVEYIMLRYRKFEREDAFQRSSTVSGGTRSDSIVPAR